MPPRIINNYTILLKFYQQKSKNRKNHLESTPYNQS